MPKLVGTINFSIVIFTTYAGGLNTAKTNNPSLSVYDGWMSRPLNNARLTSIDTYYQWVPMFEALQKQYADDWAGFFEAVKRLDKNPPPKDS